MLGSEGVCSVAISFPLLSRACWTSRVTLVLFNISCTLNADFDGFSEVLLLRTFWIGPEFEGVFLLGVLSLGGYKANIWGSLPLLFISRVQFVLKHCPRLIHSSVARRFVPQHLKHFLQTFSVLFQGYVPRGQGPHRAFFQAKHGLMVCFGLHFWHGRQMPRPWLSL